MSDIVEAAITGTHKDDDDVVWYDIEVTWISDVAARLYTVSRRYSEFDSLRNLLEKDGITVTDFPRKHVFRSNSDAVIAERNLALSDFIKSCVIALQPTSKGIVPIVPAPGITIPNGLRSRQSIAACRAFLELDQGGAGAEGAQIGQAGEQLLVLFCTKPELTVQISECGTVRMLLMLIARQMGLPNDATKSLQMEFSDVILTHETKLKDAGIHDQALFSVHGVHPWMRAAAAAVVEPNQALQTPPRVGTYARKEQCSASPEYDYLFRIVVVGDSRVGKTSLMQRFADDIYTEAYVPTNRIDFVLMPHTVGTIDSLCFRKWLPSRSMAKSSSYKL